MIWRRIAVDGFQGSSFWIFTSDPKAYESPWATDDFATVLCKYEAKVD